MYQFITDACNVSVKSDEQKLVMSQSKVMNRNVHVLPVSEYKWPDGDSAVSSTGMWWTPMLCPLLERAEVGAATDLSQPKVQPVLGGSSVLLPACCALSISSYQCNTSPWPRYLASAAAQ